MRLTRRKFLVVGLATAAGWFVFGKLKGATTVPASFPGSLAYAAVHIEDIAEIEQKTTRKHKAVRVFKPTPQTALITSDVKVRSDQGRLPIISHRITGKWFEAAQGLNGFDTWWSNQIDAMLDQNVRAIVVPTPEGDSADESARYGRYGQQDIRNAQDFNAMINHMQQMIVDKSALTMVRLCACTTGGNITAQWAREFFDNNAYYIGADPYNWCAAHHGTNEHKTFEEVCLPLRQSATQYDKPVVICETASWWDPADNSVQRGFIQSIDPAAATWPKLKAVSYFNRSAAQSGDCDFLLQPPSITAWDNKVLGGANFQAL